MNAYEFGNVLWSFSYFLSFLLASFYVMPFVDERLGWGCEGLTDHPSHEESIRS